MTTRRTDRRAPLYALLAVAAVGTLARLLALGGRIAHWSEARLGYDVLLYAESGVFQYRPVTHGPLLYHADRLLFELVGASDFAARLPVAVVGGLLPLAAWLYRDHLGDVELVLLGGVLAANPVLVYYSRFAAGDVLVAAFAFAVLGFLLRARAAGDPRYLYGASAFAAFAFASRANALLYVALWAAAGLVLLDQRALLRAFVGRPAVDVRRGGRFVGTLQHRVTPEMAVVAAFNPLVLLLLGPFSALVTAVLVGVVALVAGLALDDAGRRVDRNAVWLVGAVLAGYLAASGFLGDSLGADARQFAFALAWTAAAAGVVGVLTARTTLGARIRRWRAPATLSVVLFLALALVLFAPRNPDGLGLWSALGDPGRLPALVEAGLVAPIEEYGRVWLGGHHNDYMTYAIALLRTLAAAAVVVAAAAVVGFVANRYGERDELVEFALLWAGLSVAVYPFAAVVNAPWHAVHVVVPLAIPAAVGLGVVVRKLPRAVREHDAAVAGVALLVCCVAFGSMLATASGTAYLHPQSADNPLAQYGQPSTDFRDTLEDVHAVADANDDGPDVVYYGAYFHVENDSVTDGLPIGDVYTQRDDEWELVGENEGWYNRLPLPWYLRAYGATTDSADRRPEPAALLDSEPPVLVTHARHASDVANVTANHTDARYQRTTVEFRKRNVTVAVFVDQGALARAESDRAALSDQTALSDRGAPAGPGSALAPAALPVAGVAGLAVARRER